jgi:hypothetical protein
MNAVASSTLSCCQFDDVLVVAVADRVTATAQVPAAAIASDPLQHV